MTDDDPLPDPHTPNRAGPLPPWRVWDDDPLPETPAPRRPQPLATALTSAAVVLLSLLVVVFALTGFRVNPNTTFSFVGSSIRPSGSSKSSAPLPARPTTASGPTRRSP